MAGGSDALSRAPVLFSDAMVRWLAQWMAARSVGQKLALAGRFRPGLLAPVLGIVKGLTDPMVGLLMGQTAENVAYRFGIDRREMDEYAAESNRRVLASREAGLFDDEIIPLVDGDGKVFAIDDGARADATLEKLGKLRPVFDKPYGNITAGNSSQISDGAAWLILASKTPCDSTACSRSAAFSTPSGAAWRRPKWASARSTRRPRCCSATTLG